MAKKTNLSDVSIRDTMTSNDPATHIFYEHQGERSVDPLFMIENGILLWNETVYTDQVHDNQYLWDLASQIIEMREETPMYSWIEWVRYKIVTGAYTPKQWKSKKPFPFKGLLISAIYFHEARRMCEENQQDRAWHITVLAHYYLGLNSGLSALKNTSRAAMIKHAGITEKIRALTLAALDKIKLEQSADSIESAKKQVIEMLRAASKKKLTEHWIDEFDTLVSDNTKGRNQAKDKNSVLMRIQNMLDSWCLPSGPYPEIYEAFSHFNKRKRTQKKVSEQNSSTTDDKLPTHDESFYMRLINYREDGYTMTMKFSKLEDSIDKNASDKEVP